MSKITLVIEDENAMMRFGASLASILECGDVICLQGPLGAGKTTLARGLITQLCGAKDAPSPTYTLVETYEASDLSLWHFDLYRLEEEKDVWELGLEESLDEGVSLIEWPERIASLIPENALHLEIVLDQSKHSRLLQLSGGTQWCQRLSSAGIV